MKHGKSQSGLTLLELIITITVAVVTITLFAEFIAGAMRSSKQLQTNTILQTNTKLAVENVAQSIREAKRIQANNANPDSNAPSAPGNLYSWTGATGSNSTLIIGFPARDSSNNLIYIDGAHTSVYLNDIIYYIGATDKVLYRRIVKNPSAIGNVAVTTCPPASATALCPADAKVVEDVADLTTTYYDGNNNVISVPTGTEAVEITLKQTKTIGGKAYSSSFTTIASLRNK